MPNTPSSLHRAPYLVTLVAALTSCAGGPTPRASETETETTPRETIAAETTPAELHDRDLYEILVRLAAEPASVAELAPRVESVHSPVEGIDDDDAVARDEPIRELVTDPSALLRRYGPIVFLERGQALDEDAEEPDVTCTCDAAELTCTLAQAGGTTELRFAREGSRVVLREHRWEHP